MFSGLPSIPLVVQLSGSDAVNYSAGRVRVEAKVQF